MTNEIARLITSATNMGGLAIITDYHPIEVLAVPTTGISCANLSDWSYALASAVANLSNADNTNVDLYAGKVVMAMAKVEFARFGSGIIIY